MQIVRVHADMRIQHHAARPLRFFTLISFLCASTAPPTALATRSRTLRSVVASRSILGSSALHALRTCAALTMPDAADGPASGSAGCFACGAAAAAAAKRRRVAAAKAQSDAARGGWWAVATRRGERADRRCSRPRCIQRGWWAKLDLSTRDLAVCACFLRACVIEKFTTGWDFAVHVFALVQVQ